MKIGTKSVLFGVHQFLWHPWTVGLAWRRLFKAWPTWREWVCIFVHDLGYCGKPNMDGPEGRMHPEFGGQCAERWLGGHYAALTFFHSREYAKLAGEKPSKLCWADKYSVLCEWRWFYLLRARLSGEVHEFRDNAPEYTQPERDIFWLNWYRTKVRNLKEIREILDRK